MDKPILFLNNIAQSESFTTTKSPPRSPDLPQRNRKAHADYLAQRFQEAWCQIEYQKEQRKALSLPSRNGSYINVRGLAGYELAANSLERQSSNAPRLVSTSSRITEDGQTEKHAIVYVPSGQEKRYLDQVKDYATKLDSRWAQFKNKKLIESIEGIELALLENLWQDFSQDFPNEIPVWCELWLRTEQQKADDIVNATHVICRAIGIETNKERLDFPERSVIIIRANRSQLQELFAQSDNLAELRLAKEPVSFWSSMPNYQQTEAVDDLIQRISYVDRGVSICILDTGINNGHLLLEKSCSDSEKETYNPEWSLSDHEGHGTQMAGISLFGDLQNAIETRDEIILNHRLFSGKILPPPNFPDNQKALYGDITAQTISKCEIKIPDRIRQYCLAVTTSYETDFGRPSSWSAAVDKLAFGDEGGPQRLFLISAGNASNCISKSELVDFPDINLKLSIQSPAQSWNAITVGAFTEKTRVSDEDYQDYTPLAQHGELSPHSTTSIDWEKTWPNKPDIVFEGGNLLKSPTNDIESCDELSILTTSWQPIVKQFELFDATSAATAQASWMAAQIQCVLPSAWPETIRALLVHSAEWTPKLTEQFQIDTTKKGEIGDLLRIAGYGVPNLEQASSCALNHLTLISQETIQPFSKEGGTNEMHFYELPWPREALSDLGAYPITLKITLSYFIEPSPGELQTQNRYTYASHGLRFDLNSPEEANNIENFKKRINKDSRTDDDDKPEYEGIGNRWKVGPVYRSRGTVQSDSITLSGIELADCNHIAVYPVGGWWKTRKSEKCMEKKCRYSLVVSLHTDSEEIDIYTPVETMMTIRV
ncbi:S8 family peptidase [Gaoshiqia sp. Z1-71]|uniref:S8 family peptidase n=1 Tax=Gaoshiqia hydrogeniformans TaxID=3290090 RepID=UPI003BF80F85